MKKLHIFLIALGTALFLGGCDGNEHPMHDDEHMVHDDAATHGHEANGTSADYHSTHTEGMEETQHANSHTDSGDSVSAPEGARQITVTATDYAFDPADITAKPDETLFITLVNRGKSVHMWQIRGMSETHIHTPVGETSSKVINMPEETGDYEIYCGTSGHEELGMVGTLKIRNQ